MIWYDNHRKKLYIKEDDVCREIVLRPKELGIWELLYNCDNHPVSRKSMCDEVWDGRYVTDFTINQTINQLRKKIGPLGKEVVITFPRKGYAINADLVSVCTVSPDIISACNNNALPETLACTQLPGSQTHLEDPFTVDSSVENPEVLKSKNEIGDVPSCNNDKNLVRRFFRQIYQSFFR